MGKNTKQIREIEGQIMDVLAEHLEPLLDGCGCVLVIRGEEGGTKYSAITISDIEPTAAIRLMRNASASIARDHPEALQEVLDDLVQSIESKIGADGTKH